MLPTLLLLGQLSGAPSWSSSRPPECSKADGSLGTNVWDRAKAPEIRVYCDLLASATSRLVGAGPLSADVLALAEEATRAMPGRAAPWVLRGRALSRMGRHPEALTALEEARKLDERALDEPNALLAWARANARAGRSQVAEAAYRALLPRASQLASADRGPAYLEAGLLLVGRGKESMDDALAILRQARREAQDSVQAASVVALALALDRDGEHEQARALIADRAAGDVRRLEAALTHVRVREALAGSPDPAEEFALRGMLLEDVAPGRAAEAYRGYLEKSKSRRWEAHARARAEALSGRARAMPRAGKER